MNNNLTFISCDSSYENSHIVLFGAPFDGTTTFRPGTRFAPPVIRQDSYGLETYSPYQDRDLEDYMISDFGDLELVFGNTSRAMDQIYEQTKEFLNDEKIPFMFGGEHLVSYGSIKACHEKYPDLHVLHFDAHTDLREEYMGEEFSHSSVMKLAHNFLGDDKIFQFGIRSGLKSEFEFAVGRIYQEKFGVESLAHIVKKLKDKPVYITIDLDILDPSVFPGTGTLEPGGITFKEMQAAIAEFQKLNNVIGCDVVELSPHYDQSGASNAVACKVIREVLVAIAREERI